MLVNFIVEVRQLSLVNFYIFGDRDIKVIDFVQHTPSMIKILDNSAIARSHKKLRVRENHKKSWNTLGKGKHQVLSSTNSMPSAILIMRMILMNLSLCNT